MSVHIDTELCLEFLGNFLNTGFLNVSGPFTNGKCIVCISPEGRDVSWVNVTSRSADDRRVDTKFFHRFGDQNRIRQI